MSSETSGNKKAIEFTADELDEIHFSLDSRKESLKEVIGNCGGECCISERLWLEHVKAAIVKVVEMRRGAA